MSNLINIELPNGVLIKDIPEGTSRDEIMDKALESGIAKYEDFNLSPPPKKKVVSEQEVTALSKVDQYLKENMDLPLGIVGASTGAAMGSPLGPPGMFVGGMIGGAIGTFSGQLLSDGLEEKDLDYAKAVEESLLSAGFDIATLGAGKVIKPVFISTKKALGFNAKETAEEIIKEYKLNFTTPEVGTSESLYASQRILEPFGASLTPHQAKVSGISVFYEKIANAGLLSSSKMELNTQRVNEAVKESLNEVVNNVSVKTAGTSEEIAEVMFEVLNAGKQELGKNYEKGLEEIQKLGAKESFSTGFYSKTLENFVKENQLGEVINSLSDNTISYIEQNLKALMPTDPNVRINLNELIALDKKITTDIREKFGNKSSPLFSDVSERELSILASRLREATIKALEPKNPKLAQKYTILKNNYALGLGGILPELNKNFINQASKGNYKALGNLLTNVNNINQLVTFKNSLREAFKQAKGKELGGVSSFKEAEDIIKTGFLQKTFPDITTGDFTILTSKYNNLAKKLSDKTESAKFKAILGEDYPRVKQIINLMSEASASPQSTIGELFIRSKEYQGLGSLTTLVTGGLGGVAGGAAAGGATGAALGLATIGGLALFIPNIMAKAITSSKHVNKLITLNNTKFKTQQKAEAALAVVVSDIVDSMTGDERSALKNYVRSLEQPTEQED